MNGKIGSSEFKANPYAFYAQLRAEAPVYHAEEQNIWLVTRYADVVALLKDERFVKDKNNALIAEKAGKQGWTPGVFKPLERNMLDLDAPDHTRLRGLVHKAFTPRLIEQMRQRVQSLSDGFLDVAQSRGQMDLIRDFALPLPTTVIAEILGVPVADQHKFHHWSSVIVASNMTTWGMMKALPSTVAFLRYIRKLVKARREMPQDDLISALVQVEEAGDQMDEDELVAMIFLLLVAGHETTVNLIGNGTLALLQHPEQMAKLQADPTLIKPALEELLRYNGPLEMATERYASQDINFAGVTIPRGALVYGVLASANRDEAQFPNADVLDITRDPNQHLAFGQGVHYCLGASLARLEGQIALSTLLRRMPDLQLALRPEDLHWQGGLVLRGVKSLPVLFERNRATA